MEPPKPGDVSCSPTWAQPSVDGSKVYVACNKSSDVVEIDVPTWTMTRRFPMGPGVYNLAASHDGKLLVGTNKRGQSVSVVDLASGKEIALLPTKRKVASGVVISPDDRYAFVTVEGIGSEPGTVEVIDLRALRTVAVGRCRPAGGRDRLLEDRASRRRTDIRGAASRTSVYALGGLDSTRCRGRFALCHGCHIGQFISALGPWRVTRRCRRFPAARRMLSTPTVQRPVSRSGRRRRWPRDGTPDSFPTVQGGGCPARQSPTGPDTSGDSVGGVYECSIFVGERGGGSARFRGNLDGFGAG